MDEWQVLVPGTGRGEVLVLDEPLSFWGGIDAASGRIIDVHHPQCGESVRGRVVVMPYARGSSSTANTLAESIHRGTGPVAIVMAERDEIVTLGALVAGELYDEWCPVIVATPTILQRLRTGQLVRVDTSDSPVVSQGG